MTLDILDRVPQFRQDYGNHVAWAGMGAIALAVLLALVPSIGAELGIVYACAFVCALAIAKKAYDRVRPVNPEPLAECVGKAVASMLWPLSLVGVLAVALHGPQGQLGGVDHGRVRTAEVGQAQHARELALQRVDLARPRRGELAEQGRFVDQVRVELRPAPAREPEQREQNRQWRLLVVDPALRVGFRGGEGAREISRAWLADVGQHHRQGWDLPGYQGQQHAASSAGGGLHRIGDGPQIEQAQRLAAETA